MTTFKKVYFNYEFFECSGKFGLWIDGDLNCGRTDDCSTYGNPPLVEEKDFVIKTLECWAFLTTASQEIEEQVE